MPSESKVSDLVLASEKQLKIRIGDLLFFFLLYSFVLFPFSSHLLVQLYHILLSHLLLSNKGIG